MRFVIRMPRSRHGLRVSIPMLMAVGIAGCSSDVTRFSDSPFSSPYASRNTPAAEVTGSITRAPTGKVVSQPLPQTQAAALPPPPMTNPSATGTASGAPGMGSYRPPYSSGDITGSVAPEAQPQRTPPQVQYAVAAPRQQTGRNTVVTVGPGDTLAAFSRRYGVSIGTLIKANNLSSPNDLKIGQQIVIPREGVAAAVAPASQPRTAPAASYGGFHIAGPGDTLSKISRRYRVSVVDLARANNIAPGAHIKLGDRLAIPARAAPQPQAQVVPHPAPQTTQTVAPPQRTAAVVPQPHAANLASPTQTPEAESKADGAGFRWPVRGRIIAAFGAKPNGQQNDGINIAVPEGTPVKAAEEGEVAYAGNELKGYGNLILVRHPNGFVTAYAHARELLVKRGDKVKRGQIIAKSGRTGAISAPQLHFEIRKGSTPVDPTPYLGA